MTSIISALSNNIYIICVYNYTHTHLEAESFPVLRPLSDICHLRNYAKIFRLESQIKSICISKINVLDLQFANI